MRVVIKRHGIVTCTVSKSDCTKIRAFRSISADELLDVLDFISSSGTNPSHPHQSCGSPLLRV